MEAVDAYFSRAVRAWQPGEVPSAPHVRGSQTS